MDTSDFVKKLTAVLFIIAGILLVFFFVYTLGKDKGFHEPKFEIIVYFKKIGGLTESAPVRLAGVNVGNVGQISFLEKPIDGRVVKVYLEILQKYKNQFKNQLRFTIQTEGVLGEKIIEIGIVEGAGLMDYTKPIIGEDPLDIADIAQGFATAADSFTKTSQELSKIDMVELSNVMLDSSKALLVTSQGLNEIMGELQEITQKSKRIFDRIEQKVIDGDLFKVF